MERGRGRERERERESEMCAAEVVFYYWNAKWVYWHDLNWVYGVEMEMEVHQCY